MSFNRRFVEMWEIPDAVIALQSDEAALQAVLDQIEDPQAFLAKIGYLYENPEQSSQDEILLKDGRIFDRYSAPLAENEAHIYGRIWFFRDITERRQSELAIHRAKDEAERANHAKSEFLSRMSHELRTPLNAILGFAQVMEMRATDDKDREGVDHILKAGRHLLDLINEVLDIARIEAGRMSLSPEPVPVTEVVREVLSLVQPLSAAQEVEIVSKIVDTEDEPHDCHVLADQQRFKQVLLNLVSNALKYNRRGGRVDIECSAPEPSVVRITVTDTGYGLSPQEIESLFIPFERLGAARSQIEGTGIGLALSKRLTEAMNGTIGVASTVGEGSSFWVELPRAEPPLRGQHGMLEEPWQIAPAPDPEVPRHTVLYIEDNLSNLKLMEVLLEDRMDVNLLSAMQGSLGFDLARQHRPDLILLDLHLPDIYGDQVLRQLREDPGTCEIPVVMVSADATPKQVERLLAAGAKDYLTKPLDVRQCLRIFEETLKN